MVSSLDTSAKLAIDTQSLEQLRTQAKHSPDQALKAAAQQFESVFLNMMLKSMREATPQDGMFDSEQTKMFTGMLDQQLSQSMSSRGVGLAEVMVKQLSRTSGAQVGPGVGATVPIPAATGNTSAVGATTATGRNLPVDTRAMDSAPRSMLIPSAYSGSVQQDFINQMTPHALQASKESGVPPQLMLGQAALESGWGKREIRMADGSNSFNLFGVKANAGWKGKVTDVTTTEYNNGVAFKQVEKFRAYSSYAEAFKDYASLLSQNPRYAGVLQQGNDATGMAQALQKAGYATDPKYADKLVRVMDMMKPGSSGA
jgi:flagellar protein FlgJ